MVGWATWYLRVAIGEGRVIASVLQRTCFLITSMEYLLTRLSGLSVYVQDSEPW